MLLRCLFTLPLLLLLPAMVRGQPAHQAPAGRPLNLADVTEIALQHNPTLAAAGARIEMARGSWTQAGLYPNPVIGYQATEVGNRGTAGQQGAFIRQRFVTGGKRRLDRAVSQAKIDEAESHYSAQQLRVLNDVQIRFYDALAAQRRVMLTRELARIGDELARTSRRLLETRQISETDLMQAEIEVERTYILLDNARNEGIETWQRLSAAAGIDLPAIGLAGSLEADFPRLEWTDCYERLLGHSPELAAARARVEGARQALTRARRERIPNVDVVAGVRHNNVTSDDVANVQIGIPLPIFDANQGNIHRADAELLAAESEVRRVELDLQDRLAAAYRRYSNARQQTDRYSQKIVGRARQSLDIVSGAYKVGQAPYLTLITAQRTFLRVSLAHLDSLRELRESAALIEGQLLGGSLSRRP